MKTLIRYLITTFISLAIILICGYFLLADYYKSVFPYGTYINGIYCTGMTPAEVNEYLCDDSYVEKAFVTVADKKYWIKLDDIAYKTDYSEPVNSYFSDMKPYKWMKKIGHEDKNFNVEPTFDFDGTKLEEMAVKWKVGYIGGPHNVTYRLEGDNGYVVHDGKISQYSEKLVVEKVKENLDTGIFEIAIGDECVDSVDYTMEDKALFSLAEKVDAFQNRQYTFKLDTEVVTLSKSAVVGMLEMDEDGYPILDESGNVVFNENSVYNGLYKALSPYNSYHNHTFTTHDGKKVYLDFGNYGNEIDIKAEAAMLYEAMLSGEDNYSSTPEYKNKANYSGPDDIGPTYVEVDVDAQTLFYFENGNLKLTSDIVTGNKGRHYDTPEGVYAVFYKQRNRTLVGETYRSFVQYWIEFYPHYGLHDASWRKPGAFGGDIYLTNGSHGCVNMPTEKVAECYDIIEKGTPVIVYSYENSRVD